MTLPAIDSLDTYCGALEDAMPVVDAATDEAAASRNAYAANVAMMTHTAPRAMRRFLGHATTPADPSTGFVHDALWGSANGVKPTLARTGAGIYTVTWPTTVNDELGATHSVNLRLADAWVEVAASTEYLAHARVTAANIVEVRVFAAGALDDAVGLAIVVLAW